MQVLGRAVPSVVLAAALLAGCTVADAPPTVQTTSPPAPTPTPSATPTPTPTAEPAAAPEPPPELQRTDEIGAAAAAEYFLTLYGYTMQTGNVTAWDSMSHESCEFCASTRALALQIAADNERYDGGDISPNSVTVLARDELVGGYPVDVQLEQGPATHRGADGAVLATDPGRTGSARVDTLPSPDGWKILTVVSRDT